jgi:hypothetical protein
LSQEEKKALVELAKDKSIVISKADKGNTVVVQPEHRRLQAKGHCNSQCWCQFKEILNNKTREKEKRLQGYLRSLHDDKVKAAREHRIPLEVYKKIMPCGSRAGVMYGLPKIHKERTPVRPIISAVKTYNYNLAKWLNEILTPVVDTTHMLKDTYDFVNKISTLDSNVSRYQVSFDVESLFTNVPTKEAIDIILDTVYTADVKLFHNLWNH